MKWIVCEFEHLFRVDFQPLQGKQDMRDEFMDTPEMRAMLENNAVTLLDGDDVLACVGVSPQRKGVCAAWAFLSARAIGKPVFLTRSVRRFLDTIEQYDGYRRIEAAVAVEHGAGHRWIRSLGFEHEGRMKNYGVGGQGDFDLYARTR